MPYRVDIADGSDELFERLVDLGALDAERLSDGGVAALMPDRVRPKALKRALGVSGLLVTAAVGRDDGSVWILAPRPFRAGPIDFVPAGVDAPTDAIRLIDAAAFGTGLHPTTSLCMEAIAGEIDAGPVASLLDVGTGSGILALGALRLGVPRACGLDTDTEALRVAAENARINGLETRLDLLHGGPAILSGTWPLIVANVLAAPLMEMSPTLVRRLGHHGRLVLSGIPASVGADVAASYQRLGMRQLRIAERGGWVAITLQASW